MPVKKYERGADTPESQLAARISTAVLETLDAWRSAFWDLPDRESFRLQTEIEQQIASVARRWLREQKPIERPRRVRRDYRRR